MIFGCPNCSADCSIPDAKLSNRILKVRCTHCRHVFFVKDPALEAPASGSASVPPLPDQEDVWFYAMHHQSMGPVSLGTMRYLLETSQILSSTLVWKEGLAEWAPLARVPELTDILKAIAAPRPPSPGAPSAPGLEETEPGQKKDGLPELEAAVSESELAVDLAQPPAEVQIIEEPEPGLAVTPFSPVAPVIPAAPATSTVPAAPPAHHGPDSHIIKALLKEEEELHAAKIRQEEELRLKKKRLGQRKGTLSFKAKTLEPAPKADLEVVVPAVLKQGHHDYHPPTLPDEPAARAEKKPDAVLESKPKPQEEEKPASLPDIDASLFFTPFPAAKPEPSGAAKPPIEAKKPEPAPVAAPPTVPAGKPIPPAAPAPAVPPSSPAAPAAPAGDDQVLRAKSASVSIRPAEAAPQPAGKAVKPSALKLKIGVAAAVVAIIGGLGTFLLWDTFSPPPASLAPGQKIEINSETNLFIPSQALPVTEIRPSDPSAPPPPEPNGAAPSDTAANPPPGGTEPPKSDGKAPGAARKALQKVAAALGGKTGNPPPAASSAPNRNSPAPMAMPPVPSMFGDSKPRDSLIPVGLSQEQIISVVNRNLERIRFCYDSQLRRDPSASGKLVVSFQIQNSGKVATVTVKTQRFKGGFLEDCVKTAVLTWKFPIFSGEPVSVDYPFVFVGAR